MVALAIIGRLLPDPEKSGSRPSHASRPGERRPAERPEPTESRQEDVHGKCMAHAFGDPKLGYTASGMIGGPMAIWRDANPGKEIEVHSRRTTATGGGWWQVEHKCEGLVNSGIHRFGV